MKRRKKDVARYQICSVDEESSTRRETSRTDVDTELETRVGTVE